MRGWLVVMGIAACGPLPPETPPSAPPPPAKVKLAAVSEIAGTWSGSDRDGWTYRLAIDPAGAFTLALDRGAQGPCTEKGKVAVGDPDRALLAFTYEDDACNPSFSGATVPAEVRAREPELVIAWPDAIVSLRRDR